MMTSDERKLNSASLIPLEIDAASVLSLSKGVIFDTIVHNIEHTLSKRRADILPWKLTGMSLICDPTRNKKYMQKLQKMQCLPSVICTEIYHSKLIITDSGAMSTPGRKIVIPIVPRKRLTGIIVARSIDDLLHMEPKTTTTAHFIQYKLLTYERIPTREIVHGPRLSSLANEKILKTVFDFELTQNNGFPRQLLPVAIISFSRQEGSDLCASIHNFLQLDEHKTFDKSYLVTSTNLELIRLREEQERREDHEAEVALEKAQRRQPFADLSKKSTETANARPPPISIQSENVPRVPPLKLKLSSIEKLSKPPAVAPTPIEKKFQCALNLERIDLSLFDISNHREMAAEYKNRKSEKLNRPGAPIKIKEKTLPTNKSHEHQKSLKRLKDGESKKSLPSSPTPSSSSSSIESVRKEKSRTNSLSTRTISIDTTITLNSDNSIISASPAQVEPQKAKVSKDKQEKVPLKKKIQRPPLPDQYQCSISLSRIDLSLFDIDLPTIVKRSSNASHEKKKESSKPKDKSSKISKPIPVVNERPVDQSTSNTDHPDVPLVTENSLMQSIDLPSSMIIDALVGNDPDPMEISPMEDFPSTLVSEILSEARNENPPDTNQEIQETSSIAPTQIDPTVTNLLSEENILYVAQSPDLPPMDDDPVLFSINHPENPPESQPSVFDDDCIIIVECSDDDLDYDLDEEQRALQRSKNSSTNEKMEPIYSSPLPPPPIPTYAQLIHSAASINGHRSSRSSSCSSLSTTFLHNQSPRAALNLIKYLFSRLILNKQQSRQRRDVSPLSLANRETALVPLYASESLVDPRLIYRLKTITTDLRWPSACAQCSISDHIPSLFNSPTQTISVDSRIATNCLDPRRDSLKTAILNHLYHRLTILCPHLFVKYSSEMNKLLFEQTTFKTNCSVHLEYLLHRIQITDDEELPDLIHKNDEFELSSSLVKMMFS